MIYPQKYQYFFLELEKNSKKFNIINKLNFQLLLWKKNLIF